jgi:small subunit ribosomal protein S4
LPKKNKHTVCRYCRREGEKLFLKGERCFSNKCAMEEGRNPNPPGGLKFGRRTTSDYNTQLREKQKVKRAYGLRETQFKNYYKRAASKRGITGDNLVEILERRLDNVVYRLGFADSRQHARQLVRHGHYTLNGKRADIPSMQIRDGDVVQLKPNKVKKTAHKSYMEKKPEDCSYPWLEVDYRNMRGTFKHAPSKQEHDHKFQMNLIVEFYSR